MNVFPAIKRFLRKPAVILGEISAIAIAGTLGASLPELHVFQSVWFAIVPLLAAMSLMVVASEQFRRLRLQWTQKLTPAHFQSAPMKAEFERPATARSSQQKIWSERRLGLAGSLVFHIGLLLLIIAGAWRALFATEAVVDLVEGETLAPTAAWSAQWPGVFGKPIQLSAPITLESVSGGRYTDGSLRELSAKFSAGEIAVNRQLHFGGNRLYLAQEFGPSALLEWSSAKREAVLLANSGGGNFSGQSSMREGVQVFFHS
ncbi:MAG TPA: cytochrome c biogenesis protein ResB, partial [Candidatus Paceibacterota bacterium]|nr:cytochrome c biogenesis protein ResB [Candidatus Paceibacterota bacterium]